MESLIKFRIATKSFHIKYLFIRSELLRLFYNVEFMFSLFTLFVDEDMSFSTQFFSIQWPFGSASLLLAPIGG